LDRAGSLTRIRGLSDPFGSRGPHHAALRRLVAGGEQGPVDRALRGARHGGFLRAWGSLPGPPLALPLLAVAPAAAAVDRLDARPLHRSEMVAPAALRGARQRAGPELGRFPVGPRRGHVGRRADYPPLAVEPHARAGLPCGTGADRTVGRAATRT